VVYSRETLTFAEGHPMPVIAIRDIRSGCRISFDTEESRDEAVRVVNSSQLCAARDFVTHPEPSRPTAISSLDSDETERILREMQIPCRMLLDALDAVAKSQRYESGDAGRLEAWRDFVDSSPGQSAIEAERSGDRDPVQSVREDLRDGLTLDQHPTRGKMYRDWARNPAFVRAGELLLSRLNDRAP
jgi:hypothetical protein